MAHAINSSDVEKRTWEEEKKRSEIASNKFMCGTKDTSEIFTNIIYV